jgi:hypothetical protein
MLGAQQFVSRIFGLPVRFVVGVGDGALADAIALYENLGLQQLLCRPCFALHVVNGVINSNVGIKTEDHFLGMPRQLAILYLTFTCHFAE